jgi:hypothetical protein
LVLSQRYGGSSTLEFAKVYPFKLEFWISQNIGIRPRVTLALVLKNQFFEVEWV